MKASPFLLTPKNIMTHMILTRVLGMAVLFISLGTNAIAQNVVYLAFENSSLYESETLVNASERGLIKLTNDHIKSFIDAHNIYRAEVGIEPLTWNNKLAEFAAEWATQKGKQGCKMVHRPNNQYGENLFWSLGMDFDPAYAVDQWGAEKYDYNDELVGQEKAMVGHYTQMVWRTTTEVGCAAYQCSEKILIVCNYNPPGNYMGQHPDKNK
jgi:hypothetical protein